VGIPLRLPLLALNFGFPGTIITSFPCQLSGIQREFPYIYTDAVEELLAALRKRPRDLSTTTLADLVSIIIGECSGFLFNEKSRSDKRFRFLNLYEQEISNAVSTRACRRRLFAITLHSEGDTDSLEQAAQEVGCFEEMKHNLNKLMQLVDGKGLDSAPLRSLGSSTEMDFLGLLGSRTEMDLMKRLKHIRRELDVILKVVTEQKNVIEQLCDRITPTEHPQASSQYPMGKNAVERARQRIRKLEKRKSRIEALDAKAEHIFNDVSRFTCRENDCLWLILKARKFDPAKGATDPDFPDPVELQAGLLLNRAA
jgi:hypothetical protein